MKKHSILRLLLCLLLVFLLTTAASAAVEQDAVHAAETTADITDLIYGIRSTYLPSYSYFVSHSTQMWVGEDNTSGDLTQPCTNVTVGNSHGRFGGLWQSNGFARFVFYRVFGTYPAYDYHCNPSSLNDNVILVGRCASNCRLLRGGANREVTPESVKELLSQGKMGDLIVLAPQGLCRQTGTTMVFLEANEAGIKVYQADYTGSCVVTEDTVPYSTLASYHCVSLLRAVNYPTEDYLAPVSVTQVTVSSRNLPQGDNLTVTWLPAKYATDYRLSVMSDDAVVSTLVTDTTTHVFTDLAPGSYRVQVEAFNDKGQSDPTLSDAFTVYPMLTVNFVDHDGMLISSQKVPYGGDATAPTVPVRTGHKFAGWSDGLKNITADTTITALYELEKYTVTFYSVGKAARLDTQQVPYGSAAVLPENKNNSFGLSDGYIFSGWHIEFGSDGTDYNCVDGDMTVIATQSWDRSALPVVIDLYSAQLQEDGKTYHITGNLLNSKLADISCKLIATLSTSTGKTVKCVILDEYTIPGKSAVAINDTIIYSEKITSIEYYAVLIRDNDKTGGICAAPASVGITAEKTWSNWSDWTATAESGHDAVETKVQYRYRNKVTTTSSAQNLTSPWQYSHNTYVWSGYSAYSGWSSSKVTASDSVFVQSRVAYKWFYYACPYCGGHSYYNQHYTWAGGCGKWIADSYYRTTWGSATYASGADFHGTGRYYTNNTDAGRAYCWKAWRSGSGGATQTQYRYKTRSQIFTYHYWKWDEWSQWSDTYIAGDEVEQRTIYRYRDEVDLSDPNAGMEDNSGKEFTLTGTISLSDSTADLNGRSATVMVYKKTNTDPTEAQLEYVGQTDIGENNSYNVSFRPKEDPSEETGEFIVALGIEGCDKLVNIGIIRPENVIHTVRYYVDGQLYASQEVPHGTSATLPDAPEKEGYTFLRWSETATCVQSDLMLSAVYQPIAHTITFIDWETGSVSVQTVLHGESIPFPVMETVSGTVYRSWNKYLSGQTVATESMVVESVAKWQTYTVTFSDGENTLSTQTVEHGKSAVLPDAVPQQEGKVFSGWTGPCSWDNITRSATFTPVFLCEETTAVPEASVTDNGDGTSSVSLSCATRGATIYYIIENGKTGEETPAELTFRQDADAVRLDLLQAELMDFNFILPDIGDFVGPGGAFDQVFGATGPMEDSYSFTENATQYFGGEILLQEGQSIVFLASSDGMNDSAPQSVSGENAQPSYTLAVTKNTLRQYRATVEGEVCLTVTGDTPAFTECQFTLCLYDEYGLMTDLVPITAIVAPGSNEIRFEDFVIPTDRVCTTAKLMVWLTEGDVTPVVGVYTIVIN